MTKKADKKAEILKDYHKQFANPDSFSSRGQFSPELEGRLYGAFENFLSQVLDEYAQSVREEIVARLAVEVMETTMVGGKELHTSGHIHGVRRAIYLINYELGKVRDTANEELQVKIDSLTSSSGEEKDKHER